MSNWSRLIKSFAELFSKATPRGQKPPASGTASYPLPRRGVGGFLANNFDRFRTATPPPVQQEPDYQPLPPKTNFDSQTDEGFDAVELLGRDATYDRDLWRQLQSSEIRVVASSNVYSYAYEPYAPSDPMGTLFVTFLSWTPGMKNNERSGPGATYAYSEFPRRKYDEFNAASQESAGAAVWDYCRLRGSQHGHQHQYRLVSAAGEYVPRKATANGYKRRTLINPGLSPNVRRTLSKMATQFNDARNLNQLPNELMPGAFRRSTLPDQTFGRPNRGEPNRGTPNRGR